MNYREYRKRQLESGKVFQDFVIDVSWHMLGLAIVTYSSKLYQQTVGESRIGAEIKYDRKMASSPNCYIEFAEKAIPREGPYANSGIRRTDNTWLWISGDYDDLFYIQKSLLVLMFKSGKYKQVENGTKTSLGFLVPKEEMEKYCAIHLRPRMREKVKDARDQLEQEAARLFQKISADPRQLHLFSGSIRN